MRPATIGFGIPGLGSLRQPRHSILLWLRRTAAAAPRRLFLRNGARSAAPLHAVVTTQNCHLCSQNGKDRVPSCRSVQCLIHDEDDEKETVGEDDFEDSEDDDDEGSDDNDEDESGAGDGEDEANSDATDDAAEVDDETIALNWKDDLAMKARDSSYARQSGTANLRRLVYGQEEQAREADEPETVGDMFKLKSDHDTGRKQAVQGRDCSVLSASRTGTSSRSCRGSRTASSPAPGPRAGTPRS